MSNTTEQQINDIVLAYAEKHGLNIVEAAKDLYPTFTEPMLALIHRTQLESRIAALEHLKTVNKFGFERLDTVVEYQDGTASDIPYRHHWNDCYDKFVVTIDDEIKTLQAALEQQA